MLATLLGLIACSDYSLDEKETYIPEEDDTAVEEIVEPSEYADILISPNPIEFGHILKDCPSDPIDVTITNTGLADLEISDIYLDGQGSESFSTTYDGSALTLAHDESITLGAYFLPNLYLNYEIELKVDSNDPDDATATALVFGTGSEGALYEETFFQEYNTTVDVLWVIDNSCSMQDNVENVRNNFSSFLGSFLSLGLDYQMAMITTDVADNGSFQGAVMNSSQGQSTVSSTFNSTINNILSGAGSSSSQDTEKGLEVTQMALNNNPSFLRHQDNGLSVILITDEDDNGSSPSSQSFISWFQGLKSNDITLSRMSGFVDANGGLGGIPRYGAVIEATQGYTADINAQNWSSDLEAIAYAAAGLTVIFPLDQTPSSLGSITVTVDGIEVPQGINGGWTLDTRLNALVFHGGSIPEAGSTVNVSYTVPTSCN
jgi:hypothetical protein